MEVEKIVKAWITQPGFPVVSLTAEEKDGQAGLRVQQDRFLGSPTTKVTKTSPATWPIPLLVKTPGRGRKAVSRALIKRKSEWVPLASGETVP